MLILRRWCLVAPSPVALRRGVCDLEGWTRDSTLQRRVRRRPHRLCRRDHPFVSRCRCREPRVLLLMTAVCPRRSSSSWLPTAVGRRRPALSLPQGPYVAIVLMLIAALPASAQEPSPGAPGEPLTPPRLVPRVVSPASPAGDWSAAYELGPRDRVSVAVFGQAPLSGQYVVDGDGAITFPLLGTVPAAGLTPSELAGELTITIRPALTASSASGQIPGSQWTIFRCSSTAVMPGRCSSAFQGACFRWLSWRGPTACRASIRRAELTHWFAPELNWVPPETSPRRCQRIDRARLSLMAFRRTRPAPPSSRRACGCRFARLPTARCSPSAGFHVPSLPSPTASAAALVASWQQPRGLLHHLIEHPATRQARPSWHRNSCAADGRRKGTSIPCPGVAVNRAEISGFAPKRRHARAMPYRGWRRGPSVQRDRRRGLERPLATGVRLRRPRRQPAASTRRPSGTKHRRVRRPGTRRVLRPRPGPQGHR